MAAWPPATWPHLGQRISAEAHGSLLLFPVDPAPCPSSSDSTESGPPVLFPLRNWGSRERGLFPLPPTPFTGCPHRGGPDDRASRRAQVGCPRQEQAPPVLRPQWLHVAQTLGGLTEDGAQRECRASWRAASCIPSGLVPAPIPPVWLQTPAGETLAQDGPLLPRCAGAGSCLLQQVASESLMSSHKRHLLSLHHTFPPVPVFCLRNSSCLDCWTPLLSPVSAATCREGPGGRCACGGTVFCNPLS